MHGRCSTVDVLRQDDGEAKIQVEVDVTMEDPRVDIVSLESDGHLVPFVANVHGISADRVVIVVRGIACAPDYRE